jgi:hypothetical protein
MKVGSKALAEVMVSSTGIDVEVAKAEFPE